MQKIKPEQVSLFGDRVMIKADGEPERTASGLYLPPTDKDKEVPRTGTVISIGDDDSIKVKAGDRVMFGKYAGMDFEEEFGDKNIVVLRVGDIVGLLKKD